MRLIVFMFYILTQNYAWAQQAQDFVPGEVIVKLKSNGARAGQFMGKVGGRMNLKSSFNTMKMHHFELKNNQTVQEALSELRKDPDVEYAEPNYILKKVDDDMQVDNRIYSYDEGMDMAAQSGGGGGFYSQSGGPVQVTNAWSQMSGTTSNIPIVAVVDTGIDFNHNVFINSGAIWRNPGEIASNGIDDDGNGYIDDVKGWNFYAGNNNPQDDDRHGTHVAGIILGVTQNIFANPLSAATIRIMPLKFLGADGSGTTSAAIAAIYYAVNNGAQVINNSWGGASYSQALHDSLKYAYDHHVMVAVAAGNYSKNNDAVAMYPANYPVPSLISVAAVSDYDYLASFSNYGANNVHVGAPGVGIYSTVPPNSFSYMSGTSMASPFVAGLAALALRESPQLTGYQVKNLIMSSSDYLSALNGKVSSNSRANALKLVQNAQGETNEVASQPAYTATAPRGVASADSVQKAGCGTVSTLLASGGASGSSGGFSGLALAIAFSLLPLIVWQVLRARASGVDKRRYERFVMNSEIKVNVGGRELVGQMSTISMGGLSFKADALLEKGGVVTMMIASPDGEEQVQVQGHIVWNEQNRAYGVQFDQAKEGVLQHIQGWTSHLVKAK